MKKGIVFLAVVFLFANSSFSQGIFDPRIDSVVNLISTSHIQHNMRDLTGDTIAMVGGVPRLIFSRFYTSPGNTLAEQYIYEKFQSYGYSPSYFVVDSICRHVLAVKPGTKYPNQKVIIGGHFDNILWPVNPGPFDTCHGADDNCTGTCGVLEMSRLLAGMSFDYTVMFAAWDQEEVEPWGALAYATYARQHGDSILAYINMDMLGWNYPGQNKFYAGPDSTSYFFFELFKYFASKYTSQYTLSFLGSENYGSDQRAFMINGYKVFNVAEYGVYYNPNYHKITDNYANINFPYYTTLLKPTLALLMTFAWNHFICFDHKAIGSSNDTASRVASVVIKYRDGISVVNSPPRLYYKVNNGTFMYNNAFYHNQDTFKFRIPGFPQGSVIRYYFAAQDSAGELVSTYPLGGYGISPPGTTPPDSTFLYYVYSDMEFCSTTCPKPVTDLHMTIDSLHVSRSGLIIQINVNLTIYHRNDGDLIIQLSKPGGGFSNLSQRNGEGGMNYFYTTFDDNAEVSIKNGTPPFTGRYRPETPLSSYSNFQIEGDWVLRVVDAASGNTGTLSYWCLIFQTRNSVLVNGIETPVVYTLSQNYPNPFNSSTMISYSIAKNENVELKLYDILGREVRTLVNGFQKAGEYSVHFNSGNLSSGIYFYRLQSGNFTCIRRMVVVK